MPQARQLGQVGETVRFQTFGLVGQTDQLFVLLRGQGCRTSVWHP